jgi:hypothetical protein
MHKNATKCNKTQRKWCKNKHGASKIIDTFEMYHYATSAAGSMAVEGAEESAAALGGGVEEPGAEVEEATEGMIRDTMPGAYSFAFLKNPKAAPKEDEHGKS